MSNIPSAAVATALTPIQRSTNELIRARRIQSQKNFHHAEEVAELDDTAVNSIDDHPQNRGQAREEENQEKKGDEEHVEIESLKSAPKAIPKSQSPSHLDISA
ncbi:MAG TPA: hypothetical protein VGN88_01970 [Phycisphaerae bacterium]|jgi:hypothetical protein